MRRHGLSLSVLLTLVFAVSAARSISPSPEVSSDEEKILRATKVSSDGPGLLAYFRGRTLTPAQRAKLRELIPRLGHDSFAVRQQTSLALLALGPAALPHLRANLANSDEEIKERLRALISALHKDDSATVACAAARLLRTRAPAGVLDVLLAYLPDAEDDAVAEEVLCTLAVLGGRDGKVPTLLVDALKDGEPSRRGAAALVLGRSGTPQERAMARSLLSDRSPLVRFRAAQGLLAGRDRGAIPALIALLTEGSPDLALRAAELLGCIAGSRAPRLAPGSTASTRRRCRAAWLNWWHANPHVDLVRADVDLPPLNPTLRCRQTARQFVLAFLRADRETITKIAEAPFLFGSEKVFPQVGDLENQLVAALPSLLGQTNGDPSSLVGAVRNLDTAIRTVSATERAFLGRFRKGEIRIVEVLMQPSIPSATGEGTLVLLRQSGRQTRVVGFNPSRWLPLMLPP